MKSIVMIFIGVMILYSCNHGSSKIEERIDQNDTITIRSYYVNDILEGPVMAFYPNGDLWTMWTAIKGKGEGKSIAYYPNGRIKSFKSNKHGQYHGYSYFFSETGALNSKELFVKDVKLGHAYYYTSKGYPKEYRFTGYSNGFFFRQLIDTISGNQWFQGDKLVDYKIIRDSLKDETRFMVALPFGSKPHVEMHLIKQPGEYDQGEFSINEMGEHVFKGNLLTKSGYIRQIIMSSFNKNGKMIEDNFIIRPTDCIEVSSYVPDPTTK